MNELEYLTSIIKPILKKEEDLKIEKTEDEMGILLLVNVNKEDMGRVIGKGGTTVNSIRVLMRQYASIRELHISIKIIDKNENRE